MGRSSTSVPSACGYRALSLSPQKRTAPCGIWGTPRWAVQLYLVAAFLAAGASRRPQSYRAVTDRIPRPRPALPQLGVAGSTFADPTFGTRLIRVTDPNVIPSFAPMSYATMVNGNNTAWNAD